MNALKLLVVRCAKMIYVLIKIMTALTASYLMQKHAKATSIVCHAATATVPWNVRRKELTVKLAVLYRRTNVRSTMAVFIVTASRSVLTKVNLARSVME